MKLRVLAYGSLIGIALSVAPQQAAWAGYAISSSSASVTARGSSVVEGGAQMSFEQEQSVEHELAIEFKHGLTDNLALSVEIPYQVYPDQGAGSVKVDLKLCALPETKFGPAVSASLTAAFGDPEYRLRVLAHKNLKILRLIANASYTTDGDLSHAGTIKYSGAVRVSLGSHVNLAAEAVGKHKYQDNSASAGGGAIVTVCKGLDIAAGASTGLGQTFGSWGLRAGFEYKLPGFRRAK